jgi:hypothetical protein
MTIVLTGLSPFPTNVGAIHATYATWRVDERKQIAEILTQVSLEQGCNALIDGSL